jgi:small subunit ribosomal protein S21
LAEVLINAGESLESALKRFKRKVMNEDIIKDIKRHAFYLKPGQKIRVKAALARKRSRKNRARDSEADHNRKWAGRSRNRIDYLSGCAISWTPSPNALMIRIGRDESSSSDSARVSTIARGPPSRL